MSFAFSPVRPLVRAVSLGIPRPALDGSGVPLAAPGAPTIGTATGGDAQASVTFTAPASDGGSPITGYRVTASTGQTATGAASPITVTGLTNGVAVTFTVAAQNAVGYGPESAASGSVAPAGALGPELVTNGSFAADTNWTKGSDWSIAAGVASAVNSSTGGTTNRIGQQVVAGASFAGTYRVAFQITAGAGGVLPELRDGALSGTVMSTLTVRTGIASYTQDVTVGSGSFALWLVFGQNDLSNVSIDNVSVKKVG